MDAEKRQKVAVALADVVDEYVSQEDGSTMLLEDLISILQEMHTPVEALG